MLRSVFVYVCRVPEDRAARLTLHVVCRCLHVMPVQKPCEQAHHKPPRPTAHGPRRDGRQAEIAQRHQDPEATGERPYVTRTHARTHFLYLTLIIYS